MPARPSLSAGLVWGGLQLMLGLTWVVYAVFLPKLVAAASLPAVLVPWLLVIDQLIFAITDPWAGAAADRAADQARRIGPTLAAIATLSAIAFLALPQVIGEVPSSVLAVLLLLWAAGTAALRAPLAALIARQQADSEGIDAALLAGGLALAGVAGGFLVPAIRDVSAALAFGVVGGATALVAWLVVPAERWALGRATDSARSSMPPHAAAPRVASWRTGAVLLGAAGFLAMGLQLHTAVVAPAVLASAGAPRLAAAFWVGAALACGLYLAIRRRLAGRPLAAGAALSGCLMLTAFGLAAFGLATAPWVLAMAHGGAGLAWGLVVAPVIDAVLAFGRARGQGGLAAGLLFGLFAAAALARLALGALGVWSSMSTLAVSSIAVICWGLTTGLLLSGPGRPRVLPPTGAESA